MAETQETVKKEIQAEKFKKIPTTRKQLPAVYLSTHKKLLLNLHTSRNFSKKTKNQARMDLIVRKIGHIATFSAHFRNKLTEPGISIEIEENIGLSVYFIDIVMDSFKAIFSCGNNVMRCGEKLG